MAMTLIDPGEKAGAGRFFGVASFGGPVKMWQDHREHLRGTR
jgi:hypothetical protein